MKAYYCGFNGFGQFPNQDKNQFSVYTPTLFPFEVLSVSCAWHQIFFRDESGAYLSGLVDGEPNKLQELTAPTGKVIVEGACATNNVLTITEDGICWMRQTSGVWRNISNLLKTEVDSHKRRNSGTNTDRSSDEHKIIKVCCGEKQNLALCNLGQAYCIPSAVPIPGKKVTEIVCGFEHCLALTDEKIVYTWGSGRRGQLGHDELEDEDSPREVEMLSGLQVKTIKAGGWHSLALTNAGDVYVWGWNSSGQLCLPCSETPEKLNERTGDHFPHLCSQVDSSNEEDSFHEETVTVQARPVLVNFPSCDEGKSVTAASCGSRHTILLTDDGTAWGCGWNAYGQLGQLDWNIYKKLTKITVPEQEHSKIVDVVCGSWNTILFMDNQKF